MDVSTFWGVLWNIQVLYLESNVIHSLYPFLAYSTLGTKRTVQEGKKKRKRYYLHSIEKGLDLKKNLKCSKFIPRDSKRKVLRSKVFLPDLYR